MKKNNKGFMLVEVIIVTVVVATIMTSLYVAFNKVYTAYEEKNNYTNIDGIYALKLIKDDFVNNMTLNTMINNIPSSNNRYIKIEDPNDGSYLDNVFNEYNINELYLAHIRRVADIDDLKNVVTNQTFKDYLDYLNNKHVYRYIDYMFLVEITIDSENEIYNYAYLEV